MENNIKIKYSIKIRRLPVEHDSDSLWQEFLSARQKRRFSVNRSSIYSDKTRVKNVTSLFQISSFC